PVRWPARVPAHAVPPAGLPTYAFDHHPYWLDITPDRSDPGLLGLDVTDHPLTGATTTLADGTTLFTGRIGTDADPEWLADHAVGDTVVLPGTAFVDLALLVGEQAGAPHVDELTLWAPLVLDGTPVDLQATVPPDGDEGRLEVTVHARRTGSPDAPWVRHATAVLTRVPSPAAEPDFRPTGSWPPPGATPVPVEGLYDELAARGYTYGPAFRGVRAVWRHGADVLADVALPDEGRLRADVSRHSLHPALLDAALHPLAAGILDSEDGVVGTQLPFSWSGFALQAVEATAVRVRLRRTGSGGISVTLADPEGELVAHAEELTLRELPEGSLLRPSTREGDPEDGLHAVEWVARPWPEAVPSNGDVRTLRPEEVVGHGLPAGDVPPVVVVPVSSGPDELPGPSVGTVLGVLQAWLADERTQDATLVVHTRRGVATDRADRLADPATAAVWGLVRSAQTENPGRFVLVDTDSEGAHSFDAAVLAAVLALGESQVAVRGRELYVPALVPLTAAALTPPDGVDAWRLAPAGTTLDDLTLEPAPDATGPLAPGEIRIGVRAAGLNFRDVLIALGSYPGTAPLGTEAAGVVTEVGSGVTDLAVGDRVTGLFGGGIGPVAVTDRRLVARIPDGWTFARAAALPAAYLTAWYALVDLAGLEAGQRILVHSAAGGVGQAAVHLARHLGAEVFGTASPGKWPVLHGLGLDERHVASSRTLDFEEHFRTAAGDDGFDVVLNSFTGDFVDASLRLLGRGGRFVEMGKADIRDSDEVRAIRPGVSYRAFELMDAGPERIAAILGELLPLLESGTLPALPVSAWPVAHAPVALRHLAQARHTGKLVLTLPQAPDPDGTALITGGTGSLAAHAARHLVTRHGIRHLVLVGRRGTDAPGATELIAELDELGADVIVEAADVADRQQLAGVLARIPDAHPLTLVLHAAGVLDDGVLAALDAARLDAVLAPKATAARHLYELTRGADLAGIVLYSSLSGLVGGAGQGNYAAANAYLDALAARAAVTDGLPVTSVAWGLWAGDGGLTGHLDDTDRARMARGGVAPMDAAQGLALLDAAVRAPHPAVAAARFHLPPGTAPESVPVILRGLLRAPGRRVAAQAATGEHGDALRDRLAALGPQERVEAVLTLVQAHAAAVLGRSADSAGGGERAFKDIGFDSLTALELRNRLAGATGLKLNATTVFDHPTPIALARHLAERLAPADTGHDTPPLDELSRIEALVPTLRHGSETHTAVRARLRAALRRLDEQAPASGAPAPGPVEDDLSDVTDEELFAALDQEIDTPDPR
ncbi:SDR family NAD(P)-dependent oxidoreductase, partial [Streptomyces sp. NPDC001037]|uniref:SDR family NAD(P)-dependent oxidoreductase n=1 Tax=Streptomyces sp. NPDC001037 TaxID=3364542 RepID=UPI0036CD0A8E